MDSSTGKVLGMDTAASSNLVAQRASQAYAIPINKALTHREADRVRELDGRAHRPDRLPRRQRRGPPARA